MGPSKDKRGSAADVRRQYRARLAKAAEEERRRGEEAEAKRAATERKGGKS